MTEYDNIIKNKSFKTDYNNSIGELLASNPDSIKDASLKKHLNAFLEKCPIEEEFFSGDEYVPRIVNGIPINPPWISGNNRKQLRYNQCFNDELF
jgi:hypothetical protein